MAAVGQRTEIDRLLEYVIGRWSELPEIEREFDTWDALEQRTFVEDCPVIEDQLARLASNEDEMTSAQRQRYAVLLSVVERHRPIIARLRG